MNSLTDDEKAEVWKGIKDRVAAHFRDSVKILGL